MLRSLNSYIDHTLLKPDSNAGDVKKLCQEALKYDFASVCVLPVWVPFAKVLMKASPSKISTVVGFPLGANTAEAKAFEAKQLVQMGAEELDMVMNLSFLKSKKYQEVIQDIQGVIQAAPKKIVKVIIETCLLTNEEKRIAAKICLDSGTDFVKTSTGFSHEGADVEDIALIRDIVGEKCGIKASGGISNAKQALAMIAAGATRIGSSRGAAIVDEYLSMQNKEIAEKNSLLT